MGDLFRMRPGLILNYVCILRTNKWVPHPIGLEISEPAPVFPYTQTSERDDRNKAEDEPLSGKISPSGQKSRWPTNAVPKPWIRVAKGGYSAFFPQRAYAVLATICDMTPV
jgi:hypothetical protein